MIIFSCKTALRLKTRVNQMFKNKKVKKIALLLTLTGVITTSALAADFKSIIVHRQGIYDVMAGHMKVLKSILFMGNDNIASVNYHAKAILEAAKHHGKAFPKGSDKGKTHALPAIWEKPEEFKKAGQKLGKELQNFIEASEMADKEDLKELQGAFKKVGGACKGCHEKFREEL